MKKESQDVSGAEAERRAYHQVTPEDLLETNSSKLANKRREEFDERRANGTQVLTWVCDDARVWRVDYGSVFFNTIANGGSAKQLTGAINSPAVTFGLVMSHGPDCGGRAARQAQVINGGNTAQSGISAYIGNEVDDHTNLQSVRKAEELAALSPKVIASAYQNHRTGTLEVYAVFNRTDGGPQSHPALQKALTRQTPASTPFDIPIPALALDDLPTQLQEYLQLLEEKKQEELDRHPNVADNLLVQRPPIVKIGDNLRSAEVWLPDLAYPGKMFRMTIPRIRERDQAGKKRTRYTQNDLDILSNQLEYPIHHAVINRQHPASPFSNTDTLLIALSDITRAEQLARELVDTPFMIPWLDNERNQVLVAEKHAGILTRATRINYKVKDGEVVGYEVEKYRKA